MADVLKVGVIGDFNPRSHSHWATDAALYHAAGKVGIPVEVQWLPTGSTLGSSGQRRIAECDGLWASPGSPYKSFAGMLRAIGFARTRNWPFVGT